ncbi:hypothetical protein IFM89_035359 [Coptis chinensis]|uniref:Uncharacterized protein n=1 Tax=Coptis chinensis TaxID=261450 RepID=A0A835LFF0_9MAGN|nr:hypothetical protein IFM89_035359 [Coptis chinensis]
MGCCLSKTQHSKKTHPPHTHFPVPDSAPHRFRPPLSPVFEEESVKEVLSETPNPKVELKKQEDEKVLANVTSPVTKIEEQVVKKVEVCEEISEVSEICSLSETMSTTTITSRKEDQEENGEVQQPQPRLQRSPTTTAKKVLRKRSIPGDFVANPQRGSKSPARKMNPSPSKRNESSEMSHQPVSRRRLMDNPTRARRDPGERSGRRSRSPATRGIGRSPSRKAPRSPARVPVPGPVPLTECGRKDEETKGANESMENPLVSLECFIFL